LFYEQSRSTKTAETVRQEAAALSRSQMARYKRDGYLVIPNLLTGREVAEFLVNEPRVSPWGKEPQPLTRHKVEPHWRWLSMHPRTVRIVAQLVHGIPRVVQTAYLRKERLASDGTPNTGIGFHRDSFYIPTSPKTLLACWIALNDTDSGNGGLCVVRGSHLENPRLRPSPAWGWKGFEITHRLRDRKGREWTHRFNAAEFDGIHPADAVQLKVRRGGAVFFGGNLIHGSYANLSMDRERLAAAIHYVKDGTWVFRIDLQDTMAVTGNK
jgi:ectoine hydroxylase-related dioxygenase (phytanoyl-CoA dioxygenase family)